MPSYLVRIKKEADKRQLVVGLFSADDLQELANIVDTETDPFACEYAKVRGFAVMYTGMRVDRVESEYVGDFFSRRERDESYKWRDLAPFAKIWRENYMGFPKC